ncbi:hypothetical protein A3Q56_01579 [Intoshia linei]|uniref:C3H1-type domain-containing protein n=1 Tax=Intoshia linei TaxID=1819745 RepID=A0A177BAH1_9BILA|nr:hypothetical protein A3Q56_01579 [Intoshia linei]
MEKNVKNLSQIKELLKLINETTDVEELQLLETIQSNLEKNIQDVECIEDVESIDDDELTDTNSEESNDENLISTNSDTPSNALYDTDSENEEKFTKFEKSSCMVLYTDNLNVTHYSHAFIEKFFKNNLCQIHFLYPTCNKMKICPYFLQNKCNLVDKCCKNAHNIIVNQDDLFPFESPNFDNLLKDEEIFFKGKEDLWYPGVIDDIFNDDIDNCLIYAVKPNVTCNSQTMYVKQGEILPKSEYSLANILINESIIPLDNVDKELFESIGQWEKHTHIYKNILLE